MSRCGSLPALSGASPEGGNAPLWVVAHRGASGHAPENTMAAFRRAVELGAMFIETDLQLSRDARFVAVHDETLERTTNGEGPVHEWTLAELRELDAGSWFGGEFIGERVPTLEEILRFARETDVIFYLELKPCAPWGAEHALVAAVRRLDPTLMTGLLAEVPHANLIERATLVGARQLALRGDLVTPERLAEARRHDLQVVTWTINHPAHMQALMEAGVDGIFTDYPDRLLAVHRR